MNDGGMPTPSDGGPQAAASAKKIGTIPQLAGGASVTGFVADGDGVVMTVLSSSGPERLVAGSPTGQSSTLYTAAAGELFGYPAMDASNVYITKLDQSAGVDGLYAVARSVGGTLTPVYTMPSDGSTLLESMAVGTDNIYVVSETRDGATNADGGAVDGYAILAIAKSSGQSSTVYSAPPGQEIGNFFIDGASLYWTESDANRDNGATVIRLGTIGGATLDAKVVATIAPPSDVMALVETNGTVVGGSLVSSIGAVDGGTSVVLPGDAGIASIVGGIFSIPQGASEAMAVTSQSTIPIGVNPGTIYFNYGTGISAATVTATGVLAPRPAVTNIFASQMAGDGHGGLYYLVLGQASLYKL